MIGRGDAAAYYWEIMKFYTNDYEEYPNYFKRYIENVGKSFEIEKIDPLRLEEKIEDLRIKADLLFSQKKIFMQQDYTMSLAIKPAKRMIGQ